MQPFECCEASKHKQQRRIDARHEKEKVGQCFLFFGCLGLTCFIMLLRNQVMFYLGVAYAANIGGTGTLTASEPNVIMKGILDEKFPCQARNHNIYKRELLLEKRQKPVSNMIYLAK